MNMRIDNSVYDCEKRYGVVFCFSFFAVLSLFCHSRAGGNPKGLFRF